MNSQMEERHKMRSGRVPSTESSVPMDMRYATLLVWMCSLTWKLSKPYYWDFMEASSHRHDQLVTSIFSLSPLSRGWWGKTENSKLLTTAWFSW